MKGQRTLAYIVLIIISFFCLFWFYVLFINATRSNGALKKGFTAIPGGHLIENWKNLLAGTLPVWNGMFNSIFIATCSAVLCTYFSQQLKESKSSYLSWDHHDCKDKSEHKFFAFKIICVDGICSHGGEIGT